MGGGKGNAPPAPEPIDPGKASGEYLFGESFTDYQGVTDPALQKRLIESEREFRPQYTGLELADVETMIFGTPEGQAGLSGMLSRLSEESGQTERSELRKQRESDVQALQDFAPQAVEAYRAADPYSTRLAELAQEQAEGLFAEAGGPLSPERRRLAEQAARSGSVSRGRGMGQAAIASEILGREQFKSGLRQEARQAGQSAFQQQRALAGDIGQTILGRPSSAVSLGGQLLGQAQQGAAGQMGPQLFDMNTGINLALQQQQNMAQYSGAVAQSQAQRSSGLMGGLGSIAGGFLGNPGLF